MCKLVGKTTKPALRSELCQKLRHKDNCFPRFNGIQEDSYFYVARRFQNDINFKENAHSGKRLLLFLNKRTWKCTKIIAAMDFSEETSLGNYLSHCSLEIDALIILTFIFYVYDGHTCTIDSVDRPCPETKCASSENSSRWTGVFFS